MSTNFPQEVPFIYFFILILIIVLFGLVISFLVRDRDYVVPDPGRIRIVTGPNNLEMKVTEDPGNTSKPALLMIHGFSQSSLSWAAQLSDPKLRNRYLLAAIDMPGSGANQVTSELTAQSYARVIKTAVDFLKDNKRPVVILAHSRGTAWTGYYLQEYGAEQIEGVFNVNGSIETGPNYNQYLSPAFRELIPGLLSDDPDLYRPALKEFLKLQYQCKLGDRDTKILQAEQLLTLPRVRQAIRDQANLSIQVWAPVKRLIDLRGVNDAILDPKISHLLINVNDEVDYLSIETGHTPMLEKPKMFNNLLLTKLCTVIDDSE